MSNFSFKAKHKFESGIVNVEALDDYFGAHEYGYRVDGIVYSQKVFYREFEVIKVDEEEISKWEY